MSKSIKNKHTKPNIFIGSSLEGNTIAYAIQELLEYSAEPTVWDQDVFQPSSFALRSLYEQLSKNDFAIFIFTPDDLTEMRDEISFTVRDNVIFELGLFIGKLGYERCFIVSPRSIKSFHLPSDLFGLNILTYNNLRSDNNLIAALGPVCNKIKRNITKELEKTIQSQKPSSLRMEDVVWLMDYGRNKTEELLSPRSNKSDPGSYLVIYDVVGFESLNKKYGKELCDLILLSIDTIITDSLKAELFSVTNFRRVGDTYFIYLNVKSPSEVMRIANKIQIEIENFNWKEIKENLYIHMSGAISRYGVKEDIFDWIGRGLSHLQKNKSKRVHEISIAPQDTIPFKAQNRYSDFTFDIS